ncbi:redoxin domain-containing protein [Sphingopyxis sp.]|uniref:redoxin domain-containing protein n=1 Tax=Sphingopyxis sp. TaxID=1908224 RepID=UPI002624497A|nr:redoxin domain-containing protein [Sphingopyxis sp.]MCW0199702.1 redoxin domain-containing protein [Sphingopyxis sp.]
MKKEIPQMPPYPAPEWAVTQWFNSAPLSPDSLRGRIIVLGAFQMLCPGCVAHGLPQLQRVEQTFSREEVAVVGLHTVFEHHAAMTPVALEAFLHEYRIGFPVGVDTHTDPAGPPVTMQRYKLRGTPSLILIDRLGQVRHDAFGQEPDLALGARIAMLLAEGSGAEVAVSDQQEQPNCTIEGGCN